MISIVVPCYNSQNSLLELTTRIQNVFEVLNREYEVILVNDCSRDKTSKEIKKIAKINSNVIGVDLMFNVGQFMATFCGLEQCKGDLVITIDDDLQHPPEEIPKLVKAIEDDEDCDVVIASFSEKKHHKFRNLGSAMVHKINKVVFKKPDDLTFTGFRIMRKVVAETLVEHRTMYPLMGPMILMVTRNVKNILTKHDPRKYGRSTYSTLKLIKVTFNHILNFSTLPLKFISVCGLVVFMFSVLLGSFYFVRYLLGGINVQGWMTNVLLINLYGGLILFTLGIMGQYIIRIMYEVKKFPRFKIRAIYQRMNEKHEEKETNYSWRAG
ncbi:MAG: glycosyltransferase family 2 protein [Bacteroidales bacterium]|nr:glycosyltransferase family 2 protein [Bacteroidales bacterium]